MQVKITGSDDYGNYIKAIIVGEGGSGKTRMSSTFPNPFYLSAEAGLMSIADKGIPYIDITGTADIMWVLNVFRNEPAKRGEILGFPVDTIVVDTIDEVQQILIRERLASEKKRLMELRDWGWVGDQMKSIVTALRNLDMNVVFTCHLKETSDGDTGKVWFKPALQGGIADTIPQKVDLVLLLESRNETIMGEGRIEVVQHRTLRSSPNTLFPFLKDRSGKLPPVMDVNFEDDYDRIYDFIFSGPGIRESRVIEIESMVDVANRLPTDSAPVPASEIRTVPAQSPKLKENVVVEPKVVPVGEFEYNDLDGNVVLSINELPDGIVPVNHGFGTGFYCEMTGNEVESLDQVDLSKIRYRKILCREAYESYGRAKQGKGN